MTVLMTLRIIHILAAAGLVGSVIFNYFILRPALRLIPPAHAVVIAQRTGSSFAILGWVTLGLLLLSGALRLYFQGLLGALLTLDFYATAYGRSLGLMVLFWLVTVLNSGIMVFVLRPTLLRKLSVQSNPGLSDVTKRQAAQLAASWWLERLQLVTVIAAIVALIAGASVMLGGFF
jgi:uncharacterized membrane protein